MGFVEQAANHPVDMAPGVTRQLIAAGQKAMAVRIRLAAGSAVPVHTHPHEQIGYVESGTMRMTIGGETRLLGAGDSYVIPSGASHGAEVPEDCTVVDIFTPLREEYLS